MDSDVQSIKFTTVSHSQQTLFDEDPANDPGPRTQDQGIQCDLKSQQILPVKKGSQRKPQDSGICARASQTKVTVEKGPTEETKNTDFQGTSTSKKEEPQRKGPNEGTKEQGIQCTTTPQEEKPKKKGNVKVIVGATIGAAVGLAGTAVAVPVVVGALGFTTAGIAAGSIGASMMSTAATTGVGMAVVSTLQSVGAAGLSGAAYLAATAGGGVIGGITGLFTKIKKGESAKSKPE